MMCPSHLAGTLKYRDITDVEDKCQRFTLDVATVQLKQFYVSIFCVSQESRFENSCFDLSSWQDVNTMSMLCTHDTVLFGPRRFSKFLQQLQQVWPKYSDEVGPNSAMGKGCRVSHRRLALFSTQDQSWQ